MSSAEQKLADLMKGRTYGKTDTPPPLSTAQIQAANAPRLREGDVHLGDVIGGGQIGINLSKLIEGRLLIQGNSGAGKSMLLRRLFEQSFGRVQQLVVDADGEFSTLAEKFDVAVLSAAEVLRVGGRAFALHLREHRYSAVLDLSDATDEDRLTVVADIAEGLIDAPALHWHPLLVLVDEAQTLAPHYDTGSVEPATRKRAIAKLADLMQRGRKRGVAGVIASARIAETSKAVVAKATNIIVGRTVFDRDLERAGASLGLTVGHSRTIQGLSDGEFLCLGPALGGARRIRFKAGPVQSVHKGAAPAIVEPPKISAAESAALLQRLPSAPQAAPASAPTARGRRRQHWSNEEDQIIRKGYEAGTPIAEIGKQLAAIGRSVADSGISSRAHALGLISMKASVGWSDEEDAILRDAYAREVRIIDICGLLADSGFTRGRVAVQMRAIAIGITRDRVNYWTEAEKKIALEGLESGKPYREIIAELKEAGYERGMTSILKFAQKNNFNRAGESWTPDQIAELKSLYALRTPVKEIAEKLGKPIASVRTRASNLGLKQRTPWTEQEYEILRACHQDGKSLGEASQQIGRPYPNVARVASELGLSFKANREIINGHNSPAVESAPRRKGKRAKGGPRRRAGIRRKHSRKGRH